MLLVVEPVLADRFINKREEVVARFNYGWLTGCLFSSLFTCSGIHMKVVGMEAILHVLRRRCMDVMRGWVGDGWRIAMSDARRSDIIGKGWIEGDDEVERMS